MYGLLAASIISQSAPLQVFSIIQVLRDAGPVVKGVMLLLVVFSITSWAIIFLKGYFLRKAEKEGDIFLKIFWDSSQLDEIIRNSRELNQTPLAEIYRAGYREMERFREGHSEKMTLKGPEARGAITNKSAAKDNILRAIRRAATSEITRLEKAVPFLATCGNTSPFIGLFGTVWGIMISFHDIGQSGSASLAVVAPGISEALVATAMGLFAAIPAVIFYNHFTNKIRVLESEMDTFTADFLNILDRHIL